MSDSIDRVFGHALNTINKIRTGSLKPPLPDRLMLYGLYKQAMEGDVAPITARPSVGPTPTSTSTSSSAKEAEKWDAWHANAGMGRTEAKKRYIEKLIETMHAYATSTPEARELVAELEFVWDQVKGNSLAGSGSGSGSGQGSSPRRQGTGGQGMRVLRPETGRAVDEAGDGVGGGDGDEDEDEREEFVDAPVSQFGEMEEKSEGPGEGERAVRRRVPVADVKWRRRVETAIVKMTTEVAALRELVESRRYTAQRRRTSFVSWILGFGWFAVRLVVADVFLLWLVILYLRRRKDRRLEGAIRVMLGDAQAVAKNLATSMQNKLPSRK
ncbi:Autophagy-related protein 37 [Sphaceloma murrayae]|uniref:Autophagy-related protein 37 n=1 Tax=Sphaceloma murrayae TaxID=2082308 RepID=A0A2K1QH25_9PEZI|nr:Autophagy-related protein 37 [Sphaceloma murrayae]